MLIACILSVPLRAAPEFQTEPFLEALAMKETGLGWNGEPGPCGELSKWQIMPAVWHQEMGNEPFSRARDGRLARLCVELHLMRLLGQIGAEKFSIERLATCWHYGASHRNRASVWGQEVANLYESLNR